MAIFWCDPYIESPSGGVDGTTGIGTLGSYANPYSLNNLPNATGYSDGDEIRLKSLPANPWLTGPLHHSNSGSGQYGVYFTTSPAVHSFIKYTSKAGDVMYTSWNTPNTTYINSYSTSWNGVTPYADRSILAYKLDPQYYLSNMVNTSQSTFIRGQDNVATTLTAGWVSETTRGGETIIQHVGINASSNRWFGDWQIQLNKMTVDAPELTISQSTTRTSRQIYIYGGAVEIHAFIERSNYGHGQRIRINPALTFKAHTITTGSSVYIYAPEYDVAETQGVNRDIKYLMCGYQLQLEAQLMSNTASQPNIRLKFKAILCYYYYKNYATHWSYYDDFYFYSRQALNGSASLEEMAYVAGVEMSTAATQQFRYPMKMLGPVLSYAKNPYYRLYNNGSIVRDASYLFGGATIDDRYGDIHFRDYILPLGDTLEGSTYNNVTTPHSTSDNFTPTLSWGVDRNSGRRLAFVRGTTSTVDAMMMYNSTEYSNKLVYHLMPRPLGDAATYKNRIHLDMPTGVSILTGEQQYKLKITLAGAAVGSLNIWPEIEGNNNDTDWLAPLAGYERIDSARGGAGTVLYSSTFVYTTRFAGMQQITLLLKFKNNSSTEVAKVCFESIELVNA